jgi:glycosyltransferase involved in cell wall biosynthesis
MKTLISIIVNCYNGQKYLRNTIQSVLNQKYNNWELIFWDNQSNDDSKKIFFSFNDNRLKYFYAKKHTTLYKARNLACEKASGEYIAFLDCDDYWYDNFLSSRIKFFKKKFFDYSYSNSNYYFEKTKKKIPHTQKKLRSGIIYDFLARDYLVTISSLIIKKKVLYEALGFNPRYNIIGDFDLVMKISKNKYAFSIQYPLLDIRVHGNNFLDKNRMMFFKEFYDWYIRQNKKDVFFKRNQRYFLKKLLYLLLVALTPVFIKNFFKKK